MTPVRESGKHLIKEKLDSFMEHKLSIFDHIGSERSKRIYVRGISEIIKEVFIHLGGPIKTSRLLKMKYTKTKEWSMGRAPISLYNLELLLSFCEPAFQKEIRTKIDNKDLFINCRYSSRKVKFPKYLSSDLAYVVGLILGDGSLAGDTRNLDGNWNISAFFDNPKHHKLYDKIIVNEFGFTPNFQEPPEKGHTISIFASRVLHWFFREYFEFFNGYKCSRIFTPKRIFYCKDPKIISAFLQGLFDSDGTFTCNEARYSSTSKKIAFQVKDLLLGFGIDARINTWIKKGGYLPLYTVVISTTPRIKLFSEKIGFRHPNKKLLLANFLDSPVV